MHQAEIVAQLVAQRLVRAGYLRMVDPDVGVGVRAERVAQCRALGAAAVGVRVQDHVHLVARILVHLRSDNAARGLVKVTVVMDADAPAEIDARVVGARTPAQTLGGGKGIGRQPAEIRTGLAQHRLNLPQRRAGALVVADKVHQQVDLQNRRSRTEYRSVTVERRIARNVHATLARLGVGPRIQRVHRRIVAAAQLAVLAENQAAQQHRKGNQNGCKGSGRSHGLVVLKCLSVCPGGARDGSAWSL